MHRVHQGRRSRTLVLQHKPQIMSDVAHVKDEKPSLSYVTHPQAPTRQLAWLGPH